MIKPFRMIVHVLSTALNKLINYTDLFDLKVVLTASGAIYYLLESTEGKRTTPVNVEPLNIEQ